MPKGMKTGSGAGPAHLFGHCGCGLRRPTLTHSIVRRRSPGCILTPGRHQHFRVMAEPCFAWTAAALTRGKLMSPYLLRRPVPNSPPAHVCTRPKADMPSSRFVGEDEGFRTDSTIRRVLFVPPPPMQQPPHLPPPAQPRAGRDARMHGRGRVARRSGLRTPIAGRCPSGCRL